MTGIDIISKPNERYYTKTVKFVDGNGGAYTVMMTRFDATNMEIMNERGFGGEANVMYVHMSPSGCTATYDAFKFARKLMGGTSNALLDLCVLAKDIDGWVNIEDGATYRPDTVEDILN